MQCSSQEYAAPSTRMLGSFSECTSSHSHGIWTFCDSHEVPFEALWSQPNHQHKITLSNASYDRYNTCTNIVEAYVSQPRRLTSFDRLTCLRGLRRSIAHLIGAIHLINAPKRKQTGVNTYIDTASQTSKPSITQSGQ